MVNNQYLRLGQAQSFTHIRRIAKTSDQLSPSSGTVQRHDRPTVVRRYFSSDKAWESLQSMVATSSPTCLCSLLLNLAQHAVICTHHHGRCGVSESFVHQRSPRPRRCSWAANRQANGGGERDHDMGRASSEFGLRRGPSAQTVTWYARPPPCSLAALSACGGGLEGLRATASFNLHALPLDLTG